LLARQSVNNILAMRFVIIFIGDNQVSLTYQENTTTNCLPMQWFGKPQENRKENIYRYIILFYFTLELEGSPVYTKKANNIQGQEYPESTVIFYFEPFEFQ
jgi:hypothetical protein